MQIKSLTLKNFRGFKDTEITFSEGLTVLVGVNGAGKSSVLDALAMLMSGAAANVLNYSSSGRSVKESNIHTACASLFMEVQLRWERKSYSWSFGKANPGRRMDWIPDKTGMRALAEEVRTRLISMNGQGSVPIFVHYPSNRAVQKVSVRNEREKPDFRQTAALLDVSGVANFDSFFEWYKAREDLENELIRKRVRAGQANRPTFELDFDFELEMVRHAISLFLPDITSIEIDRREMAMTAKKRGKEVRLDQLSDGEKCLIAIVGDIARRLSLANPSLVPRTEGEGVVLIDEIEQHLHPAWQRTILGNLRRTFPNVQFIVSTHSPQVLGEVPREQVRVLSTSEDGFPVISTPYRSRGLDSNQVLKEIFEAPDRNEEIQKQLDDIFFELDKEDSKALSRARRKIDKLKKELRGEIPELIEAESMLFMLKSL